MWWTCYVIAYYTEEQFSKYISDVDKEDIADMAVEPDNIIHTHGT